MPVHRRKTHENNDQLRESDKRVILFGRRINEYLFLMLTFKNQSLYNNSTGPTARPYKIGDKEILAWCTRILYESFGGRYVHARTYMVVYTGRTFLSRRVLDGYPFAKECQSVPVIRAMAPFGNKSPLR